MANNSVKSSLQQAGIRSLQSSNNYNNKNPQQSQQQSTQIQYNKANFPRNFKLHLLNVNPQQEKNREILKQNYKRELKIQMQEQRMKKQQQKKKLIQQNLKDEKAFFEKIKLQASEFSKKQQPTFSIMRNQQNNRISSEKKVNSLENKQTNIIKNFQMPKNIQNNYRSISQKQQLQQQIKPFPNLMQIQKYQRGLDPYQNQRFKKLIQDQQSMIRKMEDLKIQIRHSSSVLQTDHEIQKIRNLLQSKSINLVRSSILDSNNLDQNQFVDNKQNSIANSIFHDNKSLQASTKFEKMDGHSEMKFQIEEPNILKKNNLISKKKINSDSQNDSEEQYDKVEMLELPTKKIKKDNNISIGSSSFVNSFSKIGNQNNKNNIDSTKGQTNSNKKVYNRLNHLDYMIEDYAKKS